MKTSCLINSYNYASFVGQAVLSALTQTVPFDEIIVVDDGSTDGSAEMLQRQFAQRPTVQVISKPNAGQLSCFNEGFARATGDVVFFLDADDLYEPRYLETALAVYRRDPHFDFVFCGNRQFGQRDRLRLKYPQDRDLGYSVCLTAMLREWIGGPTSCLSMRRQLLQRILPLPFEDAWRTRADDCLVFGASLAGARKYFLAQPLVRYRVHGQNSHCGHTADSLAVYRRRLAINRLFTHLERKLSYNVPRLAECHHREFCTIDRPTFGEFAKYVRLGVTAGLSPLRTVACLAEMTAHFAKQSLRPAAGAGSHARPAPQASEPPLYVFAADTRAELPPAALRRAA